MVEDKALEFVGRLFSMYNRTATDDMSVTWTNEMILLNEIFVEKAINNLKTNKAHETSRDMPTLKQFLDLYKRYSVEEKQDIPNNYCYVCNNKGAGLWWIYDEETGMPFQLSWYCDNCSLGGSEYNRIDITNKYGVRRHAVAISSLTNIDKLIEKNKEKKRNSKKNVQEYKKKVQRLIGMVGEIDSRDVPSKYKKSV